MNWHLFDYLYHKILYIINPIVIKDVKVVEFERNLEIQHVEGVTLEIVHTLWHDEC